MDGIERMLYSAPFTYGCIFEGRKKSSHLQGLKYYTTQLSNTTLENTLTKADSELPSSQLSKRQTSPFVCPSDSYNRAQNQIHHCLAKLTPAMFHCLINAILTTQARNSGVITDASPFLLSFGESPSCLG